MSSADPLDLLDALPCGFVQLDESDRIVVWNQRLERWTGRGRAEVAGRRLSEVFTGNTASDSLLAEVRKSRRPRVLAQLFHRRLIPVQLPPDHLSGLAEMQQECHVVPLQSPAGHLAITILDVTPIVVGQQRSQALIVERTAALRASEEQFRVLAEVAPVGIYRTDAAGRITFVNRRWCEIAGLSAAEAMGDGWRRAVHADDRERVIAAWNRALETGASVPAEFRFAHPDGTVTWLVGHSQAKISPDGTRTGFVGTITDVSNLKHAEAEQKKIEAHLRQVQRIESIGTLAGGIAHEFNNILAGTFGFLDLARLELPADHPAQSWLDRISASSQRARDLVRQILTFSRKREGRRSPQRLQIVVADALRLLGASNPPGVELESRVAAEAPLVLADATQIHQVVVNLCTNAWQALPPQGGKITIAFEPWTVSAAQAAENRDLRSGPYVRLTVADNGCGMDSATLDHIFEPFFTTKGTGSGTGLGLAVVHGIVKLHAGAITVRSAPGTGATFELYFPALVGDPTPPPAPSTQVPLGSGQRIMVVDDDPISGFAIEKVIETLNYSVRRFQVPREAIAAFAAAPDSCDLVVSDLAMPEMNGDELITRLLRIRPELPAIIVTGYVETVRQQLLENTAAQAVLHKPVTRPEIAQAIAAHLPQLPPRAP